MSDFDCDQTREVIRKDIEISRYEGDEHPQYHFIAAFPDLFIANWFNRGHIEAFFGRKISDDEWEDVREWLIHESGIDNAVSAFVADRLCSDDSPLNDLDSEEGNDEGADEGADESGQILEEFARAGQALADCFAQQPLCDFDLFGDRRGKALCEVVTSLLLSTMVNFRAGFIGCGIDQPIDVKSQQLADYVLNSLRDYYRDLRDVARLNNGYCGETNA